MGSTSIDHFLRISKEQKEQGELFIDILKSDESHLLRERLSRD
jgi:hypothetical protein